MGLVAAWNWMGSVPHVTRNQPKGVPSVTRHGVAADNANRNVGSFTNAPAMNEARLEIKLK
jgi:hypothetical protein